MSKLDKVAKHWLALNWPAKQALPNFCDEQGNIDSTKLDDLMPWSDKLPEECRKPRR